MSQQEKRVPGHEGERGGPWRPRSAIRVVPIRVALLLIVAGSSSAARADEDRVSFNRDIRPILSDRCFSCHGPDEKHRKARLRLDTPEGATMRARGPQAVVPGKPEESALIERVTAVDPDDRMPPEESGKTLSADEIALLRRWIEEGGAYERHWSFVAPTRPSVPSVDDASWPLGAIDRFILAHLERERLAPSPEADAVTLVRRLHFDLTGMPPARRDVDAFVANPSLAAYEAMVDRLLASPHYGERMAIFWLDLVRYADTVGYHGDQEHNISPYRDWVIKAFNDNMPFDRFTVEQLAGDMLPEPTEDQRIASGYNRLLQTTHEGGAQDKEYLAKYAADRVRNVSGVWMGATMGCTECHDHKYDPYTQRDFYSLVAFFADVKEQGAFNAPNSTPTTRAPEIDVFSPLERGLVTASELDERELRRWRRKTMVTVAVEPRTIRIFPRGDWLDESGDVVEPAVPGFLPPLGVGERRATRLDLARWLVSPDNPQTARVLANRLWYLFFGVGLSKTLDDLGSQGEWPTHPRLLDWLATELVAGGWDVKALVRRVVTSRAYRQSSLASEGLRRRDPENRLFARQSRFRLEAEMVRDSALAVSGLLVRRLGGPPARPYQPAGYYAHLNFPTREYKADTDASQYRRGVYMHWQRQFLHPMLKAFDAPSREECTAGRPRSNTPLAALVLLNDPSFIEAARVLAARILYEAGEGDARRVEWAWREALSRAPSHEEVEIVERLIEAERRAARDDEGAAEVLRIGLAPLPADLDVGELVVWTSVARAIMNLNEFVTRN